MTKPLREVAKMTKQKTRIKHLSYLSVFKDSQSPDVAKSALDCKKIKI